MKKRVGVWDGGDCDERVWKEDAISAHLLVCSRKTRQRSELRTKQKREGNPNRSPMLPLLRSS